MTFVIIFAAFLLGGAVNYSQEKDTILDDFRQTSMKVRDSVIDQIDYDSFLQINDDTDMNTEIYKEIQQKLNSVRIASSARYLYTAKVAGDGTYIYVVDGLPMQEKDFASPGTPIEKELFEYMEKGLRGESVISDDFMDTEWGKICTAYFPIYNNPADVYGILCMEFDMESSAEKLNRMSLYYTLIAFFLSILITLMVWLYYRRQDKAREAIQNINKDINLQLETILEGISGGFKISRNNEKYTYEYVSETAAAVQGYTSEEMMENVKTAVDNVYPPDLKGVLKDLEQQFARGDTYSCKYRVVHKDGSIRWLLDSGKKIPEKDGKKLIYSLYQDVTDFENQNIELKNALIMLNQAVRALSSGIIAYKLPSREIIIINDEAKRIFGVAKNAQITMLNKYIQDIVMPDNKEITEAVKKIKEPGDSADYVFEVKHNNGKLLKVHAYTKLLTFHDGTRFILSSIQDITKQERLISLLRQERKQYRDALTKKCEYTYSLDVTEGIVKDEFTSARGFNIIKELGLKPPVSYDEMNEKWLELQKPRFREESMKAYMKTDALKEAFENGETAIEAEYYIPETRKYTRVTALLSRSEENGHILAFMFAVDVTQAREEEARKRKELIDAKTAIEDAYERANRANAAKSTFLSNMSHDIRTPMNAIIGMTAIAGTCLDDKERVANCLAKITTSSKHLLGLINEVLDMSKIESGKLDLNEELFSLSELTDDLLTIMKPQINAKRHKLTVSVRNIKHEKLIGDSQRIQQIFTNLMSNSVKYTPEGGEIKLTISELATNKPKYGCFEFVFEDNGIGMSADFMEHLFEPFARANDSRVDKIQGTGLGMPITKNIVQMMNGSIHVESEEEKGTRVTVTIFLKIQETDEKTLYKDFVNLPVLVADDDRLSCETACRLLDELGMNSEWVLSGEEAVNLTLERHNAGNDFFSVIIDWKMPGMDGIETTKKIRQTVGKDVPIIIISAYDWSEIEVEARKAGANAFISKPLFKSRIASLFHELLGYSVKEDTANVLESIIKEDLRGKRALLAEDNELNAEIVKEILSMAGLETDTAKNGKEALDIMSSSRDGFYDIVFMDIQMPVMNGYDATKAIRALGREYTDKIPIIAMTANAFSDDVLAAKEAGMNAHLTKPLDFEQLAKTLREWL